MPFARRSVEQEVPEERIYLFYVMYLLCLAGLLGMAITGDAFNLFVFLEISSLSSYVLISLGRDPTGADRRFNYLIMGTIGATFYVIGVGMLYMMTGTLNMADLAARLPAIIDLKVVEVALAFPAGRHQPEARLVSPALLAAQRLCLRADHRHDLSRRDGDEGVGLCDDPPSLHGLRRCRHLRAFRDRRGAVGFGMLSMIAAALVAVFQDNVKRMLAYSSLSQIGYMILGIGLGNVAGLAGGMVHIFNHALAKAALFMAIGASSAASARSPSPTSRPRPTDADHLRRHDGRILSLIGVPATVGFVTSGI